MVGEEVFFPSFLWKSYPSNNNKLILLPVVQVFKIGCTAFDLLWTSKHEYYWTPTYAVVVLSCITQSASNLVFYLLKCFLWAMERKVPCGLHWVDTLYIEITSIYEWTKAIKERLHVLITIICFLIYALEQNRLSSKNCIRKVARYL